ncbi:MAG: hypothetical protein EAY81_10380 [Bacteroidetes bacterium]|nr:MAG: hypothetical protein EAY81_10380 [Bacteroidota bacterium]
MRERKPALNGTYKKLVVQRLNQALYFYQSFCFVDCKELRNRHLRVGAASGKAMTTQPTVKYEQ